MRKPLQLLWPPLPPRPPPTLSTWKRNHRHIFYRTCFNSSNSSSSRVQRLQLRYLILNHISRIRDDCGARVTTAEVERRAYFTFGRDSVSIADASTSAPVSPSHLARSDTTSSAGQTLCLQNLFCFLQGPCLPMTSVNRRGRVSTYPACISRASF